MKKPFVLFTVLITVFNFLSAQTGLEVQLGGANFLGATINSRFNIRLDEVNVNRLCPSFGVGILAPGWDQPTAILNLGINYHHRNWGVGTEVSGFVNNPFTSSTQPRDFVDMIIYPNVNYTFNFPSKFYLRFSAGPYFAFSKLTDPKTEITKLTFEGDVIPGAGIGFGYLFR